MTESEGRALARTAAVLLLASVVRWGATQRRGPPLVPDDSASALPLLLEESRGEREEQERRRTPLPPGEKLDPNRASEAELDRLPGVGPAAARAVVSAREEGRSFHRPEDLLAVRGIGPATLRRIAPHLDFSRAPPVARRGSGGGAPAGAGGAVTFEPLVGAGAGATTPGDQAAAPVDINAAGKGELETLPGVGPAIAERILEERTRRGGFTSVEELLEVRGIGPATLERLRPRVVVR